MARYSGSHGSTSGHTPVAEPTRVSPIQVQTYLKGIHYPMSGRDLASYAKQHGAPPEVMDVLNRLPDQQYDTPAQLSKAIGQLR